MQVGEGVVPQLLCCLVPSGGIYDRGWIARPAALRRLCQRYMGKIQRPERGHRTVVYVVSSVDTERSPREAIPQRRRWCQGRSLLLTYSLAPPTGVVVDARGGRRVYSALGQRHW